MSLRGELADAKLLPRRALGGVGLLLLRRRDGVRVVLLLRPEEVGVPRLAVVGRQLAKDR